MTQKLTRFVLYLEFCSWVLRKWKRKHSKYLEERWHWKANLHSSYESKSFLFLLYCLCFNNSTTRDQRLETDKLAPISKIYNQFILACEANYSPGDGCTVANLCLDSEEGVASNSTYQIKQASMKSAEGSQYVFGWHIEEEQSLYFSKLSD